MKKIALAIGAFMMIAATLFVAGCMGPDPIVGQWKEYSIPLVSIESNFYEDGTFMLSVNGVGTEGKWINKEKNLYDLDFGVGNPITGRVSDDGKKLTFEYEILSKNIGLSLEKMP
ncbi:hypothetical protein F1737_03900 [Methanoplanus sp. FWC-SCC4]|uniref:DUF5640 domain-containing protein n=1 Tax=Methanochimaera problematica TaxID=2609417 RepID=A0AA97I2S0_9EURY|nr:hypothetical protein [Methanoplanus sp. FWC-SCC4]WOF15898.1 hypothetical protein F1737_03900 [Methanoplanus sp. FWC-SCC4]